MDQLQLIAELLSERPWVPRPGYQRLVPDYLEQPHARMTAAKELGQLTSPTPLAVGALLRASLVDEEEDVRKEAVDALANLGRKSPSLAIAAVTALTAAIYDHHWLVRYAAIEGLWTLDRSVARDCSLRLRADEQEVVRRYAQQILELLASTEGEGKTA